MKKVQAKPKSIAAALSPCAAEPPTCEQMNRRIAVLDTLTAPQLRDEWRRLYRGQPPRFSRDLLIRSLAYRLQELAQGGLSKAAQRKLEPLAREMATKGSVTVAADVRLRPGARLMREWRGRTHTVIVREDGFELAGKVYPSLTQIAHIITGAHWSGPRFFGLNRKPYRTENLPRRACGSMAEGGGPCVASTGRLARSRQEVRCAIYTRKSSEEGLDQDFNSLDAQREACEAFIHSQKREGWTLSINV